MHILISISITLFLCIYRYIVYHCWYCKYVIFLMYIMWVKNKIQNYYILSVWKWWLCKLPWIFLWCIGGYLAYHYYCIYIDGYLTYHHYYLYTDGYLTYHHYLLCKSWYLIYQHWYCSYDDILHIIINNYYISIIYAYSDQIFIVEIYYYLYIHVIIMNSFYYKTYYYLDGKHNYLITLIF